MRTLVRTEGIITQLVFEHALRSRVKADQPAGAVIGEGQASVQGAIQVSEDAGSTTSGDATLHSNDSGSDTSGGTQERPSSVTSKNRKDIQSPAPAAAAPTQSSMDVGKINNLVTTDLRNITKSSDFFVMLIHLPLQVIFCVVFLYAILGWRHVMLKFKSKASLMTLQCLYWDGDYAYSISSLRFRGKDTPAYPEI